MKAKQPTKFRLPRKTKKQIPKGVYCYTPIGRLDDGRFGYKIKSCPFYKAIKIKDIPVNQRPNWMDEEYVSEYGEELEGWCNLIETDIDDQCKSCGIKQDF